MRNQSLNDSYVSFLSKPWLESLRIAEVPFWGDQHSMKFYTLALFDIAAAAFTIACCLSWLKGPSDLVFDKEPDFPLPTSEPHLKV